MSPGGLVSTTAGPDGLDAAEDGRLVRGAADGTVLPPPVLPAPVLPPPVLPAPVLPPPEELHAVITTRAASAAPAPVSDRHATLVS
jgi:hypothetical protein